MFVLTAEEKRVVCFVMLAILIGLGVKEYRRTHPANNPPNPKLNESAQKYPGIGQTPAIAPQAELRRQAARNRQTPTKQSLEHDAASPSPWRGRQRVSGQFLRIRRASEELIPSSFKICVICGQNLRSRRSHSGKIRGFPHLNSRNYWYFPPLA